MMIAVLLIEMAPPITTAMSHGTPTSRAMHANTTVVATTCAAPSPNTSRFMASMRGSENSSPSVNSRKVTPSSASSCVVAGVRHQPERMRPERHADDEVSEDGAAAAAAAAASRRTRDPASRIRTCESGCFESCARKVDVAAGVSGKPATDRAQLISTVVS